MAGDEEGGPSASRSISLPTPPTPAPVTTSTSAPVRPPTLQLKKSSTAANASASANPTGSRLVRRVTTQERLDNILQVRMIYTFLSPSLSLSISLPHRHISSSSACVFSWPGAKVAQSLASRQTSVTCSPLELNPVQRHYSPLLLCYIALPLFIIRTIIPSLSPSLSVCVSLSLAHTHAHTLSLPPLST